MPKNPSIVQSLRRTALFACGAALLIAGVSLFIVQIVTFREGFARNTTDLVSGVATNSAAIIQSEDTDAADETLAPLKAQQNVRAVAFLYPDQRVFHAVGQEAYFSLPDIKEMRETSRFSDGEFVVKMPVVRKGEPISGYIVLVADFNSELVAQMVVSAGILLIVLVLSLIVAYTLSARMHKTITDPLDALVSTAKSVAENRDYSVRADKLADDEIGKLTDAFNHMLHQIQTQASLIKAAHDYQGDQLEILRKEIEDRQRAERELADTHRVLLETSRQAGMAEVATGVLHNVGNVLNSVNVSVNCITELVTKSKITNLSRLTSLLPRTPEEFASFVRDNDKGKVLPSYLPQLGNYLADEFAQIARETGLLGKNIEHIKDIISRQQNYAKISGIIEPHAIVPLVEDAIELNSDAFHRHSVEVFRHFDTVPFVLVDKHKVLQILINLLQNAKHAVSSANERKITVVVEKRGDAVNVVVRDTGMGIRPENLTKVFTHGFTTRKDGHGFGLHSGANAAKEMGGQLSAASEGEGKGACFILSLPIAPLGSSAKNAHRLPKPAAPQPEIKEAVAAI